MLSWSISTLLLMVWSAVIMGLRALGEQYALGLFGSAFGSVGLHMYNVSLSDGGLSPSELIRPFRSFSSFVGLS